MTSKLRVAVIVLGVLLIGTVCAFAQSTLLADLKSPDWRVRSKAVNAIVKTPSLLAQTNVRNAIIDVLELETRVIDDSFRRGIGVSDELGEAYTEYTSGSLVDTVLAFANDGDMRAARALALSSYNPDSKLAHALASYGEPLVATMIQVAHSQMEPTRWNGVAVLGEMLRQQRLGKLRQPLTPASADSARETIRSAALTDPQTVVRREAVRALGVAGERSAIPILESIAATDADDGSGKTSKIDFSVRAEALRAIAAIQGIKQ